ncbi:MAG: hypothetical protein ACW981_10025 [Candidatus Hodarchaeales archaeon]
MFRKGKRLEEANLLINKGEDLLNADKVNYNKVYNIFKEAHELFSKSGDKGRDGEQLAEAYLKTVEGYQFREAEDWIESMKAFGRANVLFSASKHTKMATKTRYEQAVAQGDFARGKALNGEFAEAARLYESSAAVFQMISMEKEAASSRGKSYVQRAAQVQDDFQKSNFLAKAVEEFRRARDLNPIIEAHALFYRGRSLINVKVRDALQNLTRALEKYERIGATEQVNRVKEIIRELDQQIKDRPSEFGVKI